MRCSRRASWPTLGGTRRAEALLSSRRPAATALGTATQYRGRMCRRVREQFIRDGLVTPRQTRRTVDKADIRWALGSDDA